MPKHKSPFKDNRILKSQIDQFLNKFRATFNQEVNRTSAFFELAVYNDLVRFYENYGYIVAPQNLKPVSRDFVYSLSPNAKPTGCSYFTATKKYKKKKDVTFEIRHNIRIQSAHCEEIFVSPDYSVILSDTLASIRLKNYYNGKADYFFVASDSVQTFAEAKHYAPGPELVLNFVGLVNELLPAHMTGSQSRAPPKHIGPSLFVSGVGNSHLHAIQKSLLQRYGVNIFLGIFAYPSQAYAAKNQANVSKVGTR